MDMEKKQEVTPEEKTRLTVTAALAQMPIRASGYPALIVIGRPWGIHVSTSGDPKELAFGDVHFGFKVLAGLAQVLESLTPEEQDQLTQLTFNAMKRKADALQAAKAAEATVGKSEPAAEEETQVGGEAQHG